MITAVSLNPCIDRTLKVKKFTYGGLNRAAAARSDAGGKAINVAITASKLDVAAECIGLLYKENGRIVENKLLGSGTACDFLWLEGRVRTNIKIQDESTGEVTEVNEAGMPVTEETLDKMLDLITAHAATSDYLVLTGSLPPGCPEDFYRTIIEQVEGLDCRCVLDAEGEKLNEGIKAMPFLVKPNLYELETALGHGFGSLKEVRDAALGFVEKGVTNVAVSMGAKGALITNGDETWYAPRVDVPVQSTVGAGDAMVAALTAGFLGDRELVDVLRMGVAAGSASCMTEGTQLMEKATYKNLLESIEVQRI